MAVRAVRFARETLIQQRLTVPSRAQNGTVHFPPERVWIEEHPHAAELAGVQGARAIAFRNLKRILNLRLQAGGGTSSWLRSSLCRFHSFVFRQGSPKSSQSWAEPRHFASMRSPCSGSNLGDGIS